MNKYFLLLALIANFSCHKNKKAEVVLQLHPDLVTSTFGDSAFVSDNVIAIQQQGDVYYLLDSKSCYVIKMDKDMNFIKKYGRKGKGPGEVMFLKSMGINDAGDVLLNGNGNMINVFDGAHGRYKTQIEIPNGFLCRDQSSRLICNDNSILSAFGGDNILQGNPIGMIDIQDGTSKSISGTILGTSEKEKLIGNERVLYSTNQGEMISILKSAPKVDMYSSEYNLIGTFDLYDLNNIARRTKQIEDQKQLDDKTLNKVYYYFTDAYFANDNLYLLCYDIDGALRSNSREIMELKYKHNKFILQRTFLLDDKWYSGICISQDGRYLYASNALKSQIERYSLPSVK